jgi:hypothetical protein
LHGIERTRKSNGPLEDSIGITRIVFHYADGREMIFVPDAGRTAFSEDDILVLKNVLDRASSSAEWADINTRRTARSAFQLVIYVYNRSTERVRPLCKLL